MDAEKIVRLTPDTIHELLNSIRVQSESKTDELCERRNIERWPFAGTVEIWLPDSCYGDRHLLATMHNLSVGGLAMRTRRPIPTGTRFALAIHEPALSCYGHGMVRHCTQCPVGYLVGVEFITHGDEDDEADA